MKNQPSLLPLCDASTPELVARLVNHLRFGIWMKREEVARQLGVSVRAIRDAAHESAGQVVSGQLGMKLTICCTPEELDDALARSTSQIHQMSIRVVQTRDVWNTRAENGRKSA